MTPLWTLFDERLLEMALALPDVMTAALGDVANVDDENLPLILVRSESAPLEPGHHGDGQVHHAAAYPYVLAAFGEAGTYAEAKALAQSWQLPLEGLMYDRGLFALTGDGGERLQRVAPGEVYLEVRLSEVGDRHLGACGLSFTLHAER